MAGGKEAGGKEGGGGGTVTIFSTKRKQAMKIREYIVLPG